MSEEKKPEGPPGGFQNPLVIWREKFGKDELKQFPQKVGKSIVLNTVEGHPTTFFCDQHQFEDLKKMDHKEGDVWIVTFMKSGTTWLQEIAKHFLGQKPEDNPLQAVPWVEISSNVPMIGVPVDVVNTIPSFEGRRFFKSHWWPQDHLTKNGKSKFIYVARNGLDVCVSWYYHVKGFPLYEYEGDLNDYFNKFMAGELEFGSWFDHVKAWWKRSKDDDVLFLFFEHLKKDAKKEIAKIAEFVGAKVDDKKLDFIVEQTSFEAMKQRPLFYDMIRAPDAEKFLRGGRTGDGRKSLSAAQVKQFEERCEKEFVGEYADFPWRELMSNNKRALEDDDGGDNKK